MSVITDRYSGESFSSSKPDTVCIICKEKLWGAFVEWHGTDLFICAPCCRKIKNGLMADMVHAAAIADLRDLGYHGQTLKRESIRAPSIHGLPATARRPR